MTSEANFKTLKYCPAFPGRFGSIEDARSFCTVFFDHSLDVAYAANPARFRHRPPSPPKLPTVAWINEPSPEALIKSA